VYVRDTIRGDTSPNRVTWSLWALAPLIATVAAVSDGVSWAVLPVFAAGLGPLIVVFTSYLKPKAYWHLGILDYLCGSFSLLALVLGALTSNPLLAIFFAIISDGFAAFPTLAKAWKNPESESGFAYVAGLLCGLSTFAKYITGRFLNTVSPSISLSLTLHS